MSAAATLSDLRRPQPARLDGGAAPARRRATRLDETIRELVAAAGLDGAPVAIVAVGGYGRGDLSPHSDVDLLFVGARRDAPAGVRDVLYPLWDAGFQVGHALRTPKDAVEHAERDLTAATALLHARPIAGDPELAHELLERRSVWLRRAARRLVRRILEATDERHRKRDRAGWALAPDLKEDVGGLRDVHVLEWLGRAADLSLGSAELEQASGILLATREALHAEGARKNDRLRIDLQPAVARRLEIDLDELMSRVHSAARVVEHVSAAGRGHAGTAVLGGPRRSGSTRRVRAGIDVVDGVLVARPEISALELLAAYAHTGRPPPPERIAELERRFLEPAPVPWLSPERQAFLDLLRGPHAPAALELLDYVGGFASLLPEWNGIRGRAQHDAYHRYTVDGHTFLAVAQVTDALGGAPMENNAGGDLGDHDALYLGTLFHDIGKGTGGDHAVAGEGIARRACDRIGVAAQVADDVAALVRWHLLLPDTATRRDLDDGVVIKEVAETIGDARRLKMLYLLAIADGRATGPRAWNEWKAALVNDLYRKVLHALETGELPARSDMAMRARQVEVLEPDLAGRARTVLAQLPPSYLDSVPAHQMAEEVRLLAETAPGGVGHVIELGEDRSLVTAVVPNRPGALARTAGALTLTRISVLSAQAYSGGQLALQRLVVSAPEGARWERFEGALAAAHSGRLALEHEVERKAADYRPLQAPEVEVRFPDASPHSTVVEVRTRDALGLLYAIAAAMADLGLDIHVAKIDTKGDRVVDVFYVRSPDGGQLDSDQKEAVRRAVAHRVGRVLG